MKQKFYISYALLILCLLNSCENKFKEQVFESEIVATDEPLLQEVIRDQMIEELSKVVALSLNDCSVRQMLYNELLKQFTHDFDILYKFVVNKEVKTVDGTIKYGAYLHKIASENGLSLTTLDNNYNEFQNLQISAPSFFDKWKPDSFIPNVISLPVNYNEGSGIVLSSYTSDNDKLLITEEEVVGSKKPFLVVRQSERIDPKGMVRVDINNFVLPTNFRTLTAEQAYEISNSNTNNYKTTNGIINNSIIEIVPDKDFSKTNCLDSVKIIKNFLQSSKGINDGLSFETNQLKASCLTYPLKPTDVIAIPEKSKTIKIKWNANESNTNYEIYRSSTVIKKRVGFPPIYLERVWEKIAFIDNVSGSLQPTYYFDYNSKFLCGDNVIYQIAAITPQGCRSALSNPADAYPSWRNNNANEKIKKVYISESCWSWCCGGIDGKIELNVVPVYYDKSSGSVSLARKSLGKKTRDEQRGKWCDYNSVLFRWDINKHAYNYLLSVYEDDGGNGNGVTVTVGAVYKITDSLEANASISYYIDNRDEEFGEVEVYYFDEENNEFSLHPEKGSAKIMVGQ